MEVPAPDCQATQLEEALREDLPAALATQCQHAGACAGDCAEWLNGEGKGSRVRVKRLPRRAQQDQGTARGALELDQDDSVGIRRRPQNTGRVGGRARRDQSTCFSKR